MVDYLGIPALQHYVLEDSFVLDVTHEEDVVTIHMDFVYAKSHPELRPAREGEWTYCREGKIRFRGVSRFVWSDRAEPAVEPDGSRSWDGFDVFEQDSSTYTLRGDVGSMSIVAQGLEVETTGPV